MLIDSSTIPAADVAAMSNAMPEDARVPITGIVATLSQLSQTATFGLPSHLVGGVIGSELHTFTLSSAEETDEDMDNPEEEWDKPFYGYALPAAALGISERKGNTGSKFNSASRRASCALPQQVRNSRNPEYAVDILTPIKTEFTDSG